jgi:hypothetical protein
MPPRASKDVFGNPLDPFAASSWSQPAALLSPFLTEPQLEYANFIVTALFVGVLLVVARRMLGARPLMEGVGRCCFGGSCAETCFGVVYRIFIVVRTFLFSWWVYFLRAYGEWLRPERHCKVAIIGDGLALGFGDWVTFYSKSSGMTRRFQKLLDLSQGTRSVRRPWRVFNRGHFAATSEEWNPSCPRRPRFHGFILRPNASNLFDHAFGRGSIVADAQVVVVVVGSMDCRVPKGHPGRTLAYTLEHVKALVDELRARGKIVILCELHDSRWPDDRAEQVGFIGTHHLKNTALLEYIRSHTDGCVTAGANFTHVDYHKHRHSDGVHFVSSGYDFAASDMAVTLVNACRKAEHLMALNGGAGPAVVEAERKKER